MKQFAEVLNVRPTDRSGAWFPFLIIVAVAAVLAGGAWHIATADEPCEPHWDSTIGQPGMDGTVSALIEYNGDLIAGGFFTTVGAQTVNYIARWDGSAWHPFVSPNGHIGMSGGVAALTVYNGDLIAGGAFTEAGGQTVSYIARWDGEQWHPFASGGQIGVDAGSTPAPILALKEFDGDLIAGGSFPTAGGQMVNNIARWDGSAWHPFVSGGQIGVNDVVFSLKEFNGDLIAGGSFFTAGGQTVNRIVRWDGSAWHPFTSDGYTGLTGSVYALTMYNGDLIAGGSFFTAGGQTVNRIARWDGSIWHPFESGSQSGMDNWVWALMVYNGDLIVGGLFITAGGQTVNRIARWDGSAWHPFVSGDQVGVDANITPVPVVALKEYEEDLIVGGDFFAAGGQPVDNVVSWKSCLMPEKPGDLNGDGVVDVFDLIELINQWGPCADCAPGSCPADLTGDCVVNVFDLIELINNWG